MRTSGAKVTERAMWRAVQSEDSSAVSRELQPKLSKWLRQDTNKLVGLKSLPIESIYRPQEMCTRI